MMKAHKLLQIVAVATVLLPGIAGAGCIPFLDENCSQQINIKPAASYEDTVAEWDSYEDVAKWLKSNFSWDRSSQTKIHRGIKKYGHQEVWGVPGILQSPSETFSKQRGHCKDSAKFANSALEQIDPAYNPRFLFIWNEDGPPHHWVTAFTKDGKLYFMDFGAGPKWSAVNGVHGPYNSPDEYIEYLASLNVSGFQPTWGEWRQ